MSFTAAPRRGLGLVAAGVVFAVAGEASLGCGGDSRIATTTNGGAPAEDAGPSGSGGAGRSGAGGERPIDPPDAQEAGKVDPGPPSEPQCDSTDAAWMGQLCGRPDRPCRLTADETLTVDPGWRNDAPSIAVASGCIPHVLFSLAEGDDYAFFARRVRPGAWHVEPMPFTVGKGVLFFDGDTPSLLAAYGAHTKVTFYQRKSADWTAEALLPFDVLNSATSIATAADGALYVLGGRYLATYARGMWSSTGIVNSTAFGAVAGAAAVAIGPSGSPEFLLVNDGALYWFTSTEHEAIAPWVAASHGVHQLASAPGGQTVAFFDRQVPGEQAARYEVIVAERKAPNSWSLVVLDQERAEPKTCGRPEGLGQTCAVDYEFIKTLGIVGGAGSDLRFLYAKKRVTGTYTSMCREHVGALECTWDESTKVETGGTYIGWVDSQGRAGSSLIAPGVLVGVFGSGPAATAAVDTTGAIHVALHRERPGGFEVRYLKLVAAP